MTIQGCDFHKNWMFRLLKIKSFFVHNVKVIHTTKIKVYVKTLQYLKLCILCYILQLNLCSKHQVFQQFRQFTVAFPVLYIFSWKNILSILYVAITFTNWVAIAVTHKIVTLCFSFNDSQNVTILFLRFSSTENVDKLFAKQKTSWQVDIVGDKSQLKLKKLWRRWFFLVFSIFGEILCLILFLEQCCL